MIAICPLTVLESNEVVKTKKATSTYSHTNAASYFWNSRLAPLNWICLHLKDFTRLKTGVNARISQLQTKKRFTTFIIYLDFFDCLPRVICLTQAAKDGRLSQIKTTSEFKWFCLFSPAKRTYFPSKMEFFLLLAKFQSCLKDLPLWHWIFISCLVVLVFLLVYFLLLFF